MADSTTVVISILLFLVFVALIVLAYFTIIRGAGSAYLMATVPNTFGVSSSQTVDITLSENIVARGITSNSAHTTFYLSTGTYWVNYNLYFSNPVQVTTTLQGNSSVTNADALWVQNINSTVYTATGIITVSGNGAISLRMITTTPVTVRNQGIGGSLTIIRI